MIRDQLPKGLGSNGCVFGRFAWIRGPPAHLLCFFPCPSLPFLFLITTSNIYLFLKIYLFGERERRHMLEKEEGQRERIFTQAPCSAWSLT